MKEDFTQERHHGWVIWLSILAVLLIGVGIFFYYTFFRQIKSELIEAVPTDAQFVFEINDNAVFNQNIKNLSVYFNEAFFLESLPAYQTIYQKLPKQKENYFLTISGHPGENSIKILYNTHIDKASFKKLLRSLSIDPANYTSFEQYKIYTYGTNFKSMKFVYFNHILTLSDDIELVKKALIQHTHPKNLLSDDTFKEIYQLSTKNIKQNWLLINNPEYGKSISSLFTDNVISSIKKDNRISKWSAFQLRVSQNELFLSGYMPISEDSALTMKRVKHFQVPETYMPFATEWYHHRNYCDWSTCHFSVAADSSKHYEYLVLVQDSLHKAFIPFGSQSKADELRNNYPNGIYPVTDSTFNGRPSIEFQQYAFFIERDGNYLFAPSEEALTYYTKTMAQNNAITENRFFKFSQNNVASNNIEEFSYYNFNNEKCCQNLFSAKGKAYHIGQDLAILSASCTDINNGFAAINLYLNFNK